MNQTYLIQAFRYAKQSDLIEVFFYIINSGLNADSTRIAVE